MNQKFIHSSTASNDFSKIMADEESGIAITTEESTATAVSDVTAYKLLAMEGTTFSTSGIKATSVDPQATPGSSTTVEHYNITYANETSPTQSSELTSSFSRFTDHTNAYEGSTAITVIGSQPASTTELFSTTPGPSTIQQAATSFQTVSMTEDTTGIISTTKPLPTPPPCLNGGTFINGVCHCLGNFEGSKCESYSSLVTIGK